MARTLPKALYRKYHRLNPASTMQRSVSLFFTVLIVLSLSSCDSLWFGTAGELNVDVSSTSLPDDKVAEILVVVESVSVVSVSGKRHWLVADHKPVLDLMSLQSQPARIVRGVELPRGHYGSVALALAQTAEVKLADGSDATLQVRPRERVFKIPEFDFDDGREWAELRLTFDVSGSIRDFLTASASHVQRFSPEVSVSSLAIGDRR